MNNFITRTITGFIFIVVLMGCVLLSHWAFAGLFLLITILGLFEFYQMVSAETIKPQVFTGVFISAILLIIASLIANGIISEKYFLIVVVILVLIAVIEFFRNSTTHISNVAYTFFGIAYVGIPFSMLINIPFDFDTGNYNPFIIIGFFVMVWVNDIFAYLTGMLLGKHKLAEKISPKKTWEGFFGGLVFTVIIAIIYSMLFDTLTTIDWVVIAIIAVVFGIFGDLFESLIKRQAGVKDSGNILPGHGGILDRFDAMLFSAPVVFIYLSFIR